MYVYGSNAHNTPVDKLRLYFCHCCWVMSVPCRLRQRQMRNMACALLLSHGIPMLQMGDEYGHSKNGNNNTYCHDSPLNWVDWQQVARDEQGFARFMRGLIAFRSAGARVLAAKEVFCHHSQGAFSYLCLSCVAPAPWSSPSPSIIMCLPPVAASQGPNPPARGHSS